MNRLALLIPVLILVVAGALSSIFIVTEKQKALVLQFGQIKAVREEPGLYFKIPLVQEVVYYDDRILGLDVEPLEVTPLDDRRLVVDAFARYRLTDVRRFRQAVGASGMSLAENRIDTILRSQTREVLGKVTTRTLLPGRTIPVAALRDSWAVERGKTVQLIFSGKGLTITATGTPLENAAIGDFIRVRNVETGVIISGTVMDNGSIRVAAK